MPNHDSQVALSDCIDDFKSLIQDKYSIKYDDLSYFVAEILQNPQNRLGVTILPEIAKIVKTNTSVDHKFLDSFYAGLTVTKENALTMEGSFYKNQDIYRHIFRPILEYSIEGKQFHIIGANKWGESMMLLTTNCFPFGIFPPEWKINKDLKSLLRKLIILTISSSKIL